MKILVQFTAGILDDLPVQVDFPARQCLEISEKALQLGDVMAATEWFQAAHSKVMADQNGPTSVDDLTAVWEKTYQAVSYMKHNSSFVPYRSDIFQYVS